VRPRQDALGLAALALGGLTILPGCGAMFHASQTVEIVTKPADKAVVYAGGNELPATTPATTPGTFSTPVFLNRPTNGTPVAIGAGGRLGKVKLEREVDAAAIICDILWTATIIGVAAPISDALLGTFTKTRSRVEVTFERDSTAPNPMPTYLVAGTRITATDEPVVVAASAKPAATAPPATEPAPVAPVASTPPAPTPKAAPRNK